MAKKAGFDHHFCSSRPGFFEKYMIDGGLIVLSKFPIVEKDECIFKKNIGD